MNTPKGDSASEDSRAGGKGYILSIYPRRQEDTARSCTLVVPRDATAASVVQDAAVTLALGREGLYELVELREVGGEQHVLEEADCPVERVLLWPPHAQEPHPQSQGYYFLLQERSHGDSDHGNCLPSEQGVDNLCDLPVLTEASLLANLRTRFHSNQIYTYAGAVLLAINPFRFLPVYNPKYVKLYDGHKPGQVEPHVFAMADLAFYSMLRQGTSQCIVLTGQSGSGKTQSSNFLLHCLTALSRKGYANGVERTILGAGPVLEAFGNAKTAQNDNSSRFGKLIQAHYLESGVVRGAVFHRYLLEKSRVVSREPCDRNYHVFYYMLAGASEDERQELKLLPPQDYVYLSQSSPVEDSSLVMEYKRLTQAMEMVGFLPPTRKLIFSVLSAILYLGNLTYTCIETDTDQGLEVGPVEALNTLSHLLQVKREMLVEALTKRKILTAKNILSLPYSQSEAIAVRDSMAKALYSALFDRIVLRINHSLLNRKDIMDPTLGQCLSIGILDLFGFETCRTNGFEQFCINYASELLQYFYNQHIFELEQEEYRAEGLTWQTINYRDNSGCIRLFNSRPNGLIHLLYEESSSLQATDKTLLDRFQQEHHDDPFFSTTPNKELAFTIQHFTGKVKYEIKDFRVKDVDRVPGGVVELLKHSGRAFVRSLAGTDPVAVFRWGVLRAVIRIMAAFKQAGLRMAARNTGQKKRGSRTPIGQLKRRSSTKQFQSRSSLLEFSFDRSEDYPLEAMEDIFASYERRRNSKGHRQKQIIPKNLTSTRSLQCIVDLTLRDPTMPVHLPCTSARFQVSLCKLLQTLKRAHPVFIQCIRSNAEKKEMCFDDDLVLTQLQNSGLLETVLIQRAGFRAKLTFQEFTEMFQVLMPKSRAEEPQRDVLAVLQDAGLDPSTYQIGKTKVFLKAAQWQQLKQRLQEKQSLELQRMVIVLQRWYRAQQERREFLQKRAAAILIQRWWRGIREESRYQAAAMIQALWRGSQQRAEYLKQRSSIIKMQALVRGSSARRRFLSLKDEQEGVAQEKGGETSEVGVAGSPPLQKAAVSRRNQEGKELQRQNSLGYDVPHPPQVKGQGATGSEARAAQENEEGRKRGETDGPPCPASPGTLQRYYKHSAMKKKAAKWRERRSEGGFLDSSPLALKLKDKRTEALMSQGLSLSLDNISKLSSSESDSPVTEKPTDQVRVRLRRGSRRKRRLAHARSGLMFKSVALEDVDYWTFPLPPISPAPSFKPPRTSPSHSAPDGLARSKPRVQFKSPPETTSDSSKATPPRRRSSGSSPVSPGRPGFLSRLLRKRNHRELQHMHEEPVTPTQARGLGWAPAAPLRPSSGHSRRNPTIRISRATRVSEQWNASLEREITSTNELWHLDEFLGNQVNELRTRGNRLSPTENIFLTATMAFRETIKGMYSLAKPQIRYKGLMRNYKDKVAGLAGPKQEAEVKLVVNLFQSVLDGFVRGEMRREDCPPTKPTKKEKSSSKDKFENILDHTLRTYQVNIMQSCDQCGSYIWGMEKAFMCCSCKMICHKKCLSKISTDCSTICAKKFDGETDSLQFGVRVSLLISSANPVPIVMEKMLGHVEMNGLYTEGIYRKSGSASRARELHQLLDSDVQSVCLEDYPIHTITSLVKKWLRELPDPLMTFAHYDDFLRAAELPEKSEKLRRLYKVLEQLPPANFNTLERLFFHLVIVAKEEKHNRMTANSLAIVFAPCLLRSPNTSDPFMSMNDIGKTTTCVEIVINEQLRRYNEKMEEIEKLELAEAIAINQLQLKRQNTVLEKAPEVAELELPESNLEQRTLMERIKSIKQEKDELACRLPELEQPGSDHENLDSEGSPSCESLLDIRFGSPCGEGKELVPGTAHPTSESSQEASRQHRDGVQSMYVTPSEGPAPNQPAHKIGRTLSDTDIPYIDEDM